MGNIAFVALPAWIIGAAAGYAACCAVARRLRRRVRELKAQLQTGQGPKKMGVMDKVLVFEAVVLIVYTIADMAVFWHTGAEPSTLTACVFGVCGVENGVMGWIKNVKESTRDRTGSSGPEPPGPAG